MRPQIMVVGAEIVRPPRHEVNLDLQQLWRDRRDDVDRYLVLQGEDIAKIALVAVGPEVHPGRRIDQLAGDADLVRGLAHAALQHVAHAKLAADLLGDGSAS